MVLNNKNTPNKSELAEDVSKLSQTLSESRFFEAYDDFREYHNRHHWRVVKYLDGNILVIAAAAREHFSNINGSKGIYFGIKGSNRFQKTSRVCFD